MNKACSFIPKGYSAVNIFRDRLPFKNAGCYKQSSYLPGSPLMLSFRGRNSYRESPNLVDTRTKLLSTELISSSLPFALCRAILVSYSWGSSGGWDLDARQWILSRPKTQTYFSIKQSMHRHELY